MTPRLAKILRWVGYPLFYFTAFVFFAYLTFPYDRLKERIASEFNTRQVASGYRMKIADLDSYWVSGVEAEGVELTSTVSAPSVDGKPAKPKVLTIDHAHARVSLLRLLAGTIHVNFAMKAFGGELSGSTSDADNSRSFDVELESVKMADLPMIADVVPLPLAGLLSGTIEFKLPEGKLDKADGKVALKISELSVGDGKAKIMNAIALPQLNVGELALEGESTEGNMTISKFAATGRDLELSSDGRLRLRDPFSASLTDLNLRFKFSPSFRNKNDTTRALFGSPGSTMPAMFDLDPRVRAAKRPDEFYAFHLSGAIAQLNFNPAGGGSPGGGALGGSMGGMPMPGGFPPSE